MGRSNDPVSRCPDHIDSRRGLQGRSFWQEASAAPQEAALKVCLNTEDQAVWKIIRLSRRLRKVTIQKAWAWSG